MSGQNDILTVTCISRTCTKTKTGPRSELVLWRCPEHTKPTYQVGNRATWRGRNYEILEVTPDGLLRIRTGGKNGKLVSVADIN